MATTGFLKVSWLLLYCVMSSTRINNSCQQNGLLRFKEIIDSNRIGGHRLADMNMIVFEKDVFTNLQCLDLCLRIKVCASIDIKKQNTQRSCRVNRANPKYFIIENDDWTHINVSSRALEEILASAENECKEKDTDEASSTLELSLQTPTAVSLDEYCKTKALTVDSCTQKKRQRNCSGVWEARILVNGWCCVDPESSSQHCCCPIPH
nr:uncharacterized protein LOC131787827 [Pocillopora verrucosa]